jgi:sporulation protein YqfC
MSLRTQRQRLQKKLANLLEIPDDIVLDLPRITLLGNMQMLIENHKGIIEYTSELVRVRLNRKELIISGIALSLGNLQTEELIIEGEITGICFEMN